MALYLALCCRGFSYCAPVPMYRQLKAHLSVLTLVAVSLNPQYQVFVNLFIVEYMEYVCPAENTDIIYTTILLFYKSHLFGGILNLLDVFPDHCLTQLCSQWFFILFFHIINLTPVTIESSILYCTSIFSLIKNFFW